MTDLVRRSTRVEYAEATPGTTAQPVLSAALVAMEKKAFLLGGYCNGASVAQALEYDGASKQWTPAAPLPSARSEATVVALSATSALLFGGWNDEEVVADALIVKVGQGADGRGVTYEPVEMPEGEAGPQPRRMHSMVAYTSEEGKTTVYLFGGFSDVRLNDMWKFDPETLRWTAIDASGFLPTPRDCATLVADAAGERLILFGGYTSCRVNEVFTFDVASESWARVPTTLPPSPRFGCSGVATGGYMIVAFGQDGRGPSSGVFQLNLADFKWSVANMEGDEVEQRIQHSWCVAEGGKRLLSFGGTNDKKPSTAMYEFDFDRVEAAAAPAGKGKK